MDLVLITGASGLLGSHVVKHLVIKGNHQIVILVRSKEKARFWQHYGFQTIIGDLEVCNFSLIRGIKTIIHTAAIAGDWVDKKKAYSVNVDATKYLLDQMIKINCSTFIHISTIGVYGHSQYTEATEEKPYKIWAFYEYTKIEAERLILEYRENYPEKQFHIVRPPSMYGEGDRNILPRYIKYLKRGKFIFIGGGKSLYPILHASDGARVIIAILEANFNENKTYHLCDDSKVTLKDFITILQENLGLKEKIRSIPYSLSYSVGIVLEIYGKIRKKEPMIFRKRVKYLGVTRHVSIEKVKRDLDFKPKFLPEKGIASSLQWIEEENIHQIEPELSGVLNAIPFHLYSYLDSQKL